MTATSLAEHPSRRLSDDAARNGVSGSGASGSIALARQVVQGEESWVAGIRAGDPRAFEGMFRTYHESLRAFAKRYVRDGASADEVVQDVLCWIWQHRDSWAVDTSLRTYLFGAVRNRALNLTRRQRLRERWQRQATADVMLRPDALRAEPADARVIEDDFVRALRCAVDRLPARCREAYMLRWVHHLSYREVAAQMGTSVKTAEIQIAKALKALRQGLDDFFR